MSSFYDPGNYDAPSYNAGFDDGVLKGYNSSPEHTIAECRRAVEDHVGTKLPATPSLDVERLARAMKPGLTAEGIAAEYARLDAPATPSLDARDPVAQAKFVLHRYARTTEDAKAINGIVDALAAAATSPSLDVERLAEWLHRNRYQCWQLPHEANHHLDQAKDAAVFLARLDEGSATPLDVPTFGRMFGEIMKKHPNADARLVNDILGVISEWSKQGKLRISLWEREVLAQDIVGEILATSR